VHTLPSSQLIGDPPQAPPTQVSFVVQAFPSSQGWELLAYKQPCDGSQRSSVHPLPSSQLGAAPPTQLPPKQVSSVVQALWSSQGSLLLVKTQPLPESQVSVVHPLPSSHTGGPPPTQAPLEQVSLVVQASPSLQAATLFTFTQPLAGSQESSVQTLPSLQSGAAPPTQVPPAQASLVVQASPSSHGPILFVNTQTPA